MVWLSISTLCLFVINFEVHNPDGVDLRGEVKGDLVADGNITSLLTTPNSTASFPFKLSNWAFPDLNTGSIHIRLANLSKVIVFESESWNDPRTCATYELQDRSLEIEAQTSHIAGNMTDVEISLAISEFRGEAQGGDFLSDPDYTTALTISHANGTAHMPSYWDLFLTDVRLTINGTEVYLACGGITVPENETADVAIEAEGRLVGGDAYLGDYMYDVHVDGSVVVHDLQEVDQEGNSGRYHEILILDGDDIEIRTFEQPNSFEHWSVSLSPPWTIGLHASGTVLVRSSNPSRALVEGLTLWALTLLAAYIVDRVRRPKEASGGMAHVGKAIPPPTAYLPRPVPTWPAGGPQGRSPAGSAVFGGIVCVLNSAVVLVLALGYGLHYSFDGMCIVVGIINPLIALIGGVFSILRLRFDMAVMGALFTMGSPGFWVAGPVCMPIPFVGILALVLVVAGRREFPSRGPIYHYAGPPSFP